jgi:hypothetical protein
VDSPNGQDRLRTKVFCGREHPCVSG